MLGLWLVLGVGGLVAAGSAVAAGSGSDLESSNPIDGASVKGPLGEVVLTFKVPVTGGSSGVSVFPIGGSSIRPSNIDETASPSGGTVIALLFDPGLEPGTYGVRWSVTSEDGAIEGQLQFTVASPPATTAPSTLPPTVPSTSAPPPPVTLATVAPSTPSASTTVPTTSVPATTSPPTSVPGDSSDPPPGDDSILATLGLTFRFGGTIAAVGAIAALLWVVQSDKQDITLVLTWTRMFGLVVAIGGVLEWARAQELGGGQIGDTVSSRPGIAALMAGVGGILVTFGLTERHSLAPIGNEFSWRPGANSVAGLFGALMALASFGVEGQSVARGPQSVLGVAAVVHVGVVSVWAGGVFALALVAWVRRQRRVPARTALSVVRFSPLATVALILATVSGVAMNLMIAESPRDPMATPWGRMLVVKLIVVTIAVVAGAFNRFVLLPAIEQQPDNPDFTRRVRVSLTIESVVFVVVILVTVALVTLNARPG